MMTFDEQIAILEAAKRGERIETRWKKRHADDNHWHTKTDMLFDFIDFEYRVAPRPYTLELTRDEFETLAALTERVAGDPRLSRRRHIDTIRSQMRAADNDAFDTGKAPRDTNSIVWFSPL